MVAGGNAGWGREHSVAAFCLAGGAPLERLRTGETHGRQPATRPPRARLRPAVDGSTLPSSLPSRVPI